MDGKHQSNSDVWTKVWLAVGLGVNGYESYTHKHKDNPVGGLAELADNSLEAGAKLLDISQDPRTRGIVFQDDGMGLDRLSMTRLISFGGSGKRTVSGIGKPAIKNNFGVGGKAGALGTAPEVLIFSKAFECERCKSNTDASRMECFLSCKEKKRRVRCMARMSRDQDFGKWTQETLQVPTMYWNEDGDLIESHNADPPFRKINDKTHRLERLKEVPDEAQNLFQIALYSSGIQNLHDIQEQFDAINGDHGTRILLWSRDPNGHFPLINPRLVLKLDMDEHDLVIRSKRGSEIFAFERHKTMHKECTKLSKDICIDHSFRAYLELLYRMQDPAALLPMKICMLGKYVQFQRLEYRFCRDEVSSRYVREYDLGASQFKVKFGYSGEDHYRGLTGTFFSYNKCERCARGAGKNDKSCCPPLRLVYSYHSIGVQTGDNSGGLMAVITVWPPTITIDDGKQCFKENFEDLETEIGEKADEEYWPVFEEARTKVEAAHKEHLTQKKGLDLERLCLVRWKHLDKDVRDNRAGLQFPCRLINKWDRFSLRKFDPDDGKYDPTERPKKSDDYLVEWFYGGDNQYRWVRAKHIEPYTDKFTVEDELQEEAKARAHRELKDYQKGKRTQMRCVHCRSMRSIIVEIGCEHEVNKLKYSCRDGYINPKKGDNQEEMYFCPHLDKDNVPASSALPAPPPHPASENLAEEAISGLPVGKMLGEGNQARVVEVTWKGGIYAAKFFKDKLNRRHFEKELAALSKLQSDPNCVSVHAKQTTGDEFALIMEKCDFSMETAIADPETHGNFSLYEYLLFAQQVAQGMEAVVRNSLVHADLKLSNILLSTSRDGAYVAKVADFGLSKSFAHGAETTNTFTKNVYTAPELLGVDSKKPSEQSDVYAFGWVLLQMVARQQTHWHNKELDMKKVLNRKDEKLATIVRQQCPMAHDLVLRCWGDLGERPAFAVLNQEIHKIICSNPPELGVEIDAYKHPPNEKGEHLVYRVLDDDDVESLFLKKGIIAGDPHNRVQMQIHQALEDHVRNGSARKERSGFVSTSRHLDWIMWYLQKKVMLHGERHGIPRSTKYKYYPFVAIDLKLLGPHNKIVDISSEALIEKSNLGRRMCKPAKNFAASAKEVIIVGDIPQCAIVREYEIDASKKALGNAIKDVGMALQKECLDWKWNPKKPLAKHPYADWVKSWRNHVGGEDRNALEEECLKARKQNKQWPVPPNVPKTDLPKSSPAGGESSRQATVDPPNHKAGTQSRPIPSESELKKRLHVLLTKAGINDPQITKVAVFRRKLQEEFGIEDKELIPYKTHLKTWHQEWLNDQSDEESAAGNSAAGVQGGSKKRAASNEEAAHHAVGSGRVQENSGETYAPGPSKKAKKTHPPDSKGGGESDARGESGAGGESGTRGAGATEQPPSPTTMSDGGTNAAPDSGAGPTPASSSPSARKAVPLPLPGTTSSVEAGETLLGGKRKQTETEVSAATSLPSLLVEQPLGPSSPGRISRAHLEPLTPEPSPRKLSGGGTNAATASAPEPTEQTPTPTKAVGGEKQWVPTPPPSSDFYKRRHAAQDLKQLKEKLESRGQVVMFSETTTEYCITKLEAGGFECEAKRTTASGQRTTVSCPVWASMGGDPATRTCNHIICVQGKAAEILRLPIDRKAEYERAYCEAFRTGNTARAWNLKTSEDCGGGSG